MDLKQLQIVCLLLLNCFSGIYNIPVDQLYGFGLENNDILCPREEDLSIEVPISANFPFFGHNHSQVYVQDDGELCINEPNHDFEDWNSDNGIRRVLAFFGDISNVDTGDIWYRQTTDSELLQRATSEIRRVFPWHNSFTATWMFVNTWQNVKCYGDTSNKRNTFQIVLVTDEVTSFVIFLYARIEWGTCGYYAPVAGYYSGDGVNNYYFPESWSSNELITLSDKTNVGVPGMFIFDVAPPTIAPGPIVPVECPEIVISNGSVEYSPNRESGGILNITCDDGLNLIGEETIVCDLDGTWSGSLPVCEELRCHLPEEIYHGFVTLLTSESIKYGCDPGYTLVCGDDVMSCGLDELWDGIIPQCIAITNGRVEYNANEGSKGIINITCDEGFNLVGEEALVCDDTWADSLPVCEEMDCPLQEIDNGFITGENDYGSSITYSCDPGYTLVCGDEAMSCGVNGIWDGIIPHCIAITNGSVEYNVDGDSEGIIDITCDEGFNLIGEETIVCDLDGAWFDSLPVCEEMDCPLQEINNGFVIGENNYGGSITYGCDPGYTLVCGDEVMSCGLNGIWDGMIPHCIAITNGSVEYSHGGESEGIINITCDEGFNLIGEETVVCDVDGTWADSLPVCEEINCPLQEINNGIITGENNYGGSITYDCDPGYKLVCNDEGMSCGLNGIWDGIIPHCIAITNGSVEYSHGGESEGIINITCDEGFNLIGEETVVCDVDGTWADSLPVCEEINCPLQEINNGIITGENNYGGSITYDCDPGYKLVCGDEGMSCGLYGIWDGIIPHCIAITNGSVEYSHGGESEGIINMTCDEGFNLIGEETVVCDVDGTWADSLPVCEEINCPLQEINDGIITGENNYGGSITYDCDPGYKLVCGDEGMSCGLYGIWDGIIPHCIAITNGSVEYNHEGGGIINITCDVGFNLIGEEAVVCDLDGAWRESLPICEEITCPLQEINHGFVTGENTYGDSITFGCEPGYALVCGDEVMSCGLDGSWDGIIPYCIWRGKSNVAERDFKGNVDDNQGQFCSKLRENNGDFGQRPE